MMLNRGILAHAVCATLIVGAASFAQRGNDQQGDHTPDAQQGQAGGMPELPPNHPLASVDMSNPMAMMEAWQKAATPGPTHQNLHRFVGKWNTVAKMYMDPSAPPSESKGQCEFKMILDDHYLECNQVGTMEMPGMGEIAMKGKMLMGFDNTTKLFNMFWIDNHGTGFYTTSGSLSKDGKSIVTYGQMNEPTTGEMGKPTKWVMRFDGEDKLFFEWWEVAYGDDFKVFEVEYTRAK